MADRKIRIYTRCWCEDSQAAKRFLEERHIPFEEIDIEDNPEAARFVVEANGGKKRTPTVQAGDRVFCCSPFDGAVFARELGLGAESA